MNSHIYKHAEARNLKKAKLLFLVLAISLILAAFVHFSLNIGATTTTATQYHHDQVANPDLTSKGSEGNTTNIETYFSISGRDDQIIGKQPEKTSCPEAADLNRSCGRVSDVLSSENEPIPAPIPDGRIFMRGEPPYGYLPTCSPKDRDLPLVPIEPD